MYQRLVCFPSSSIKEERACKRSCSVDCEDDCLCATSSLLIVLISNVICSWCLFLAVIAKEISFPLFTHLCASQSVMVEMSGVEFSWKYRRSLEFICLCISGSFRRNGFNLQVLVIFLESGNVRVIMIGWWSDRDIGSIVACERSDRSVWDRNKQSILEYFWCGKEKMYSLWLSGMWCATCRVRFWNWILICHSTQYGSVEVAVEESNNGISGTLKSPPKISMPSWKVDKRSHIFLKKVTWCLFGQ